jgi:hypothetical protein
VRHSGSGEAPKYHAARLTLCARFVQSWKTMFTRPYSPMLVSLPPGIGHLFAGHLRHRRAVLATSLHCQSPSHLPVILPLLQIVTCLIAMLQQWTGINVSCPAAV